MMNIAMLDDGIHSSYAATASDYDRVFLAYPDMPVPHGKGPLHCSRPWLPAKRWKGPIVSAFRMDKQQWDAGKDLSFTFGTPVPAQPCRSRPIRQ